MSYIVLAREIGVYEIPLTANVEEVVTFQRNNIGRVEIKVLEATHPIYFTTGERPATVKGGHCYDAFVGVATSVETGRSGSAVRMISAGDAIVSVSSAC